MTPESSFIIKELTRVLGSGYIVHAIVPHEAKREDVFCFEAGLSDIGDIRKWWVGLCYPVKILLSLPNENFEAFILENIRAIRKSLEPGLAPVVGSLNQTDR